MEELEAIVRQRMMLDSHHVWQGVLKGWLFVHIPLSWALVVATPPSRLKHLQFASLPRQNQQTQQL